MNAGKCFGGCPSSAVALLRRMDRREMLADNPPKPFSRRSHSYYPAAAATLLWRRRLAKEAGEGGY